MSQYDSSTPGLSRRGFLSAAGSLAVAAGAIGTSGVAAAESLAKSHRPASAKPMVEPFFGVHQGGILTPQQTHSIFAAFDLETSARADVIALLKRWTDAANRMSRGESAQPLNKPKDAAPLDGGSAAGLTPARLTLTFGFGPGLFIRDGADRYGLAARRPEALVDLPKFNGDQLIAEKSGGDLSIQACADDPQVAFHALRELVSLASGVASIKWMQSGFASPPAAGGTGRNLMGFKDGTNNPSTQSSDAMNKVVWAGDEGGWMKEGSYVVVRRIRIALEHWDKTELGFQEEVVGRYKANGAPLGKAHEFDPLDLNAEDKDGNPVIPANAHARLSSAAQNDGAQILRRAYSYNDGVGFYAERWPPWRQGIMLDAGLFFIAYQRDPRTGFIKLNKKLATEDIMNQFTTHVGSAIFACPPGVTEGSFIGAKLFEGLEG
ncbi:iron uptake transporter deferrochelatase/peroxidase subunit [Pseudomonas sp. 6D_7.1_Bac1]|jgi:deferrochelatase/peroxidase EfeB|uniref:iron uptake transporter deferrochelatase/peroxidase subunit n=1 Tax=Pseudomonas sp. 6D_7.1_Bac1 TaxID=2971615 RepID=UPI0021C70F4C|nr:iron uptake transporter deferrochelatase/peroxidase subunit [Pseudomonas sp. 6D_7.1_Bac1]MCU1748011.1 iron uptake transporter deferrochelatase/peroxidase subunit [Pseudomonas sp. 6D_7.1_Bac1]